MARIDVRNGLRPEYPFSAIVGNEDVREALMCALASPDVSSILICGPKGTGKSVIARSISTITDRRVVVLPAGSSDDQVIGGMDVEDTLREGRRRLSDSIMSRADGNILLAENINLLPQHIVFHVLNAAETGMNLVERDGISDVKECSFLLVATMDAEEGSVSDHILDRFDMCVFTSNITDEGQRSEIVMRRMAFEDDPAGFMGSFAESDSIVSTRILSTRSRTRFTRVPDGYLSAISEVCNQLNITGHRGDISVMNVSCALAALDGRDTADLDDLRKAASMCLEHRRNDPDEDEPSQPPPEEPPETPDDDREPQDGPPDDGTDPPEGREDDRKDPEVPDLPPPPEDGEAKEEVFSIGEAFRVIDYLPKDEHRLTKARAGKHTSSISEDLSGRCIGYRIPKGRINDIALVASIRMAAPYQVIREHGDLAIVLKREDLREKVRERRQGNNILFLVDGSGSIGAQRRMVAVKGAILSMLKDAYQKRDSIGMAVFRTDRAEEVLPLTRSILRAYKVLAEIPTGGRTPLIHGLIKGHEILKEHVSRDSNPVMVILSDGRCNVGYTPGMRPVDEMLATARALSGSGIRFIVIDTEVGRMRFGLALDLCKALDGTYLRLEDLNAEYIERSVRAILDF